MPFLAELDACRERSQQLGIVPRLRDEVRGAALQGPHRFVGIGVGRHEYDHGLRVAVQDVFQPLEALFAADGVALEVHVEQHHVGLHHVEELVNLFGSRRDADVLHLRLEQQVQSKENVFVVVNDEYLSFSFVHSCLFIEGDRRR